MSGYKTKISAKRSLFDLNLRELFQFRDLLMLFVKRDFISLYKQTILGPIWFFLQPLLTTIVFTFVFGKIAEISTDGVPRILFYLAGLTCWNYFSECLLKTSNTFVENQNIFGKVYFPRLITPLSIVISGLLKFGIQFILFIGILIGFNIIGDFKSSIDIGLLYFPLLVVLMSLMGLGLGLLISSLTTKYRDFRFLIQFGIQLWLYATPVIYPISTIEGKMRTVIMLNPMTGIIEAFKSIFLTNTPIDPSSLIYSIGFTIFALVIGVIVFNKTEQNFMDTI